MLKLLSHSKYHLPCENPIVDEVYPSMVSAPLTLKLPSLKVNVPPDAAFKEFNVAKFSTQVSVD